MRDPNVPFDVNVFSALDHTDFLHQTGPRRSLLIIPKHALRDQDKQERVVVNPHKLALAVLTLFILRLHKNR